MNLTGNAQVRKRDKFRGVLIKQGYGMTELSPVSHAYGDADNVRAASVGFLLPNLEMIIRDVQTNRRLGVGEIGEVIQFLLMTPAERRE